MTPKRNDYIEYLSKSLERSRIIAEMESGNKTYYSRSIDRSERVRAIEREELRRTLEREEVRKQIEENDRVNSLEREFERSRVLEKSRLL
jgi:hypothetical protein